VVGSDEQEEAHTGQAESMKLPRAEVDEADWSERARPIWVLFAPT
jgi:hypothetical protein